MYSSLIWLIKIEKKYIYKSCDAFYKFISYLPTELIPGNYIHKFSTLGKNYYFSKVFGKGRATKKKKLFLKLEEKKTRQKCGHLVAGPLFCGFHFILQAVSEPFRNGRISGPFREDRVHP